MELSDLTTYAEERYGIQEEHKWASWPGFSVLVDPRTGKWAALLMRQWDGERGEEIQRCDVKCGQACLPATRPPYLVEPFRMKGPRWVGVEFDGSTDPDVVLPLFDRAVGASAGMGPGMGVDELRAHLIELAPEPAKGDGPIYTSTPLDFRAGGRRDGSRTHARPRRAQADDERASGQLPLFREEVPERILAMQELYVYGDDSPATRVENFCRQGAFMADYEDDEPWTGMFRRFFPTYHDLNVPQLRGYFTWRTHARKGEWRPIATSLAYIYLYELLCGIGTTSPEDALEKMRDFEAGFVDSYIGDANMGKNLRRWMLEYAVLNDLPAEKARACADPALLEIDGHLVALKRPEDHGDGEVFAALCALGGHKLDKSPVTAREDGGKGLFAGFWRYVSRHYDEGGRDIFTACFGERRAYRWLPLANAVCPKGPYRDVDYVLDECREFRCRNGEWQELRYEGLYFDRTRLGGLLREADRTFRRALKTGRYLKERPGEAWAKPYVEAYLAEVRRERAEAARPKVEIDFSGLGRIRLDAIVTRDSLLVEEGGLPENGPSRSDDVEVEEPPCKSPSPPVQDDAQATARDADHHPGHSADRDADPNPARDTDHDASTGWYAPTALDPLYARILAALVQEQPIEATIAENHLMPSVVADAINEYLFDKMGDSVVECEGNTLTLVEDYREDVRSIIGGNAT